MFIRQQRKNRYRLPTSVLLTIEPRLARLLQNRRLIGYCLARRYPIRSSIWNTMSHLQVATLAQHGSSVGGGVPLRIHSVRPHA